MKFHEYQSKSSGDMERTRKCYGQTDGLTDEGHSYNTPSASRRGINKLSRGSLGDATYQISKL